VRTCPDLYGMPCRCPACSRYGETCLHTRRVIRSGMELCDDGCGAVLGDGVTLAPIEPQPVSDPYKSGHSELARAVAIHNDRASRHYIESLADFLQSGAESTPQREESASDDTPDLPRTSAAPDPVTRPAHYALDPEPLDVIEAWGMSYHEGNILKYVARWRQKGGVQDLRKAAEYLRRLIEIADREGW